MAGKLWKVERYSVVPCDGKQPTVWVAVLKMFLSYLPWGNMFFSKSVVCFQEPPFKEVVFCPCRDDHLLFEVTNNTISFHVFHRGFNKRSCECLPKGHDFKLEKWPYIFNSRFLKNRRLVTLTMDPQPGKVLMQWLSLIS